MKALFSVLLLLPSFTFAGENCPLNGYWQSDEKQTLESFNKSANKTEKQVEVFSQGFFGKLVVKIECGQFTSASEGWSAVTQYEIVAAGNGKVTIKYIEFPDDTEPAEKELQLHGQCYSIPINGGQFREFMCKSNKETFNKALNARPR